MKTYREERGTCLIEAGAQDLQNGSHWRPWLKLTQRAVGASACHVFDGLKPVFGSEQAALRYATELGRSLVDEGSIPAPTTDNQKNASWPLQDAFARPFAFLSRARSLALANLFFRLH